MIHSDLLAIDSRTARWSEYRATRQRGEAAAGSLRNGKLGAAIPSLVASPPRRLQPKIPPTARE